MARFIPGLELNRGFYLEVVKPLLKEHFPKLQYSAGLVGHGSDVLGFDTEQSMDHDWGPHMHIFLSEKNFTAQRKKVDDLLRNKLPYEYKGFSTNFTNSKSWYLVHRPKYITEGPVNHLFHIWTFRSFFQHYLAFNPYRRVSIKDWLIFPQQSLIEITSGEVYHDGLKELHKLRKKFSYYPHNVWMYMYLIQWDKIANEESFMGRTGEVGDELGSNIIATDIVSHIMRLCFLMEKKYMPYIKWFGTAFSHLDSAKELTPLLLRTVHGKSWEDREEHLGQAYEIVARMHNELRITEPITTELSEFHGRPYKVINAHDVYHVIHKNIKHSFFRGLRYKIGSIDQFINHVRINQMNHVYTEFKDIIQ
jgi:hypothetical protein